jgi:uncharacterized protein
MMQAVKAPLFALALCFTFGAAAEVAVPPLSGRVVDQTATLGSDEIASLDRTLKDFGARKGSQIAVLIVPSTEGEPIEQYSIRVAEAWKIGRKKIDDGAILVVAKNDRRLRIEVGYGLEGALNDVTAKRIIDEIITPKFRSGDFSGGISAGVDRIIRVVDGDKLPAPAPAQQRQTGSDFYPEPFNIWQFIALIFGGTLLRAVFGRLTGSILTAVLVGSLSWYFAGSLILAAIVGIIAFFLTMFAETLNSSSGRAGGSGWSGSGGSFSSGSRDSGGFSGGGGNFGGGGASGSW